MYNQISRRTEEKLVSDLCSSSIFMADSNKNTYPSSSTGKRRRAIVLIGGQGQRLRSTALVVTSTALSLVTRSWGNDRLVHAFPRSGLVSRFGLEERTKMLASSGFRRVTIVDIIVGMGDRTYR